MGEGGSDGMMQGAAAPEAATADLSAPDKTVFVALPKREEAAPASEETAHYLVILEGTTPTRRIALGTAPLTVGRVAPAELVLADPEISRSHCRIALAGDRLTVTDLQSTNGTWLDGRRITGTMAVPNGGRLRIGGHLLKYEQRNRREIEEAQELDRDIEQASTYVQSILPLPIASGPVQADWFFLPCTRLGGDAFGYQALDETSFAGYVLDVSGHGVGAAMHSVTLMNILRQRALPGADFHKPAEVMKSLNAMFQTENHNNLFFTIWYFVYDTRTRSLDFASAGQHAGILVPADRASTIALETANTVIGMMPDFDYAAGHAVAPPGSTLYLFSDGAFEIVTKDGKQWGLEDFLPLLRAPRLPGVSEPLRLYRAVRDISRTPSFDDDFSVVAFTFA